MFYSCQNSYFGASFGAASTKFLLLGLFSLHLCGHAFTVTHNYTNIIEAIPRDSNKQQKIWVNAFARSSSSTVLRLIAEGKSDVFALYEPCHKWDRLDKKQAEAGCRSLLVQLFHCDFTGVHFLWGWEKSIRNGGGKDFSPQSARKACLSANFVAIKTIDYPHVKENVTALLTDIPDLKMINVIRDPRSIYASMKKTFGDYTQLQMGIPGLLSMCTYFDNTSLMAHPQMQNLVFEALVTWPHLTAKNMYSFLELPYTDTQRLWVNENFNSDCEDETSFSTCRSNSSASVAGYIGLLTNNHYAAFMGNQECRNISKLYDYDTWYYDEVDAGHWFLLSPLTILACSLSLMLSS